MPLLPFLPTVAFFLRFCQISASPCLFSTIASFFSLSAFVPPSLALRPPLSIEIETAAYRIFAICCPLSASSQQPLLSSSSPPLFLPLLPSVRFSPLNFDRTRYFKAK